MLTKKQLKSWVNLLKAILCWRQVREMTLLYVNNVCYAFFCAAYAALLIRMKWSVPLLTIPSTRIQLFLILFLPSFHDSFAQNCNIFSLFFSSNSCYFFFVFVLIFIKKGEALSPFCTRKEEKVFKVNKKVFCLPAKLNCE